MNIIEETIKDRISIRKYLDKPVLKKDIEDIFTTARKAPSGCNTQPGFAYIIKGTIKEHLSKKIEEVYYSTDLGKNHKSQAEYEYFPNPLPKEYNKRKWNLGYRLYSILNIEKSDIKSRKMHWLQNYHFQGAPIGVIYTIDKNLALGSWLDLGMFIQNILLLSKEKGLDTCLLGSMIDYSKLIKEELKIPSSQVLVCGMALGYGDYNAPENHIKTDKIKLEEYTEFLGF